MYEERYYITKFILYADFYFNISETDYKYNQWIQCKKNINSRFNKNIDDIKPYNVVFFDLLYYDRLLELNKIKVPFILLTCMNDYVVPFNNYVNPSDIGYKLLENKNLIKWYSTNVDNDIKSDKIVSIPIGLCYSVPMIKYDNPVEAYMTQYIDINLHDMVEEWFLKNNIDKINRLCNKDKKLLHFKMTFYNSNPIMNPKTNKVNCREKALEDLNRNGFDISNAKEKLEWDKYMEDLYEYKFCLAFPGHGFDCFRIWECINLGVIPIILRTNICDLYSDLPVLIVDDSSEITKSFLNIKYAEICKNIKYYKYDKIYLEYWINKLLYDKYRNY